MYKPQLAAWVQTPPATWVPLIQIPAPPGPRMEGGFPLKATKEEGKAGETFKVYK